MFALLRYVRAWRPQDDTGKASRCASATPIAQPDEVVVENAISYCGCPCGCKKVALSAASCVRCQCRICLACTNSGDETAMACHGCRSQAQHLSDADKSIFASAIGDASFDEVNCALQRGLAWHAAAAAAAACDEPPGEIPQPSPASCAPRSRARPNSTALPEVQPHFRCAQRSSRAVEMREIQVMDGTSRGVHPSHSTWGARGLIWCAICGSWGSSRFVGLRKICQGGPTAAGSSVLRRVARGLPPVSNAQWVDPADVLPG